MLKNIINILNVGLGLLKNLFDSISRRIRLKDIENQEELNRQENNKIDEKIENKDIDGLNEMLGFKKPGAKNSAKKATTKKSSTNKKKNTTPEPKKRGRKKKSEQ